MAIVSERKLQFYSINVQAVCDSNAFITIIVARWPGSTHDSRIFENSKIADKLRDGALDGIFVGDSGYAYRAYVATSHCDSQVVYWSTSLRALTLFRQNATEKKITESVAVPLDSLPERCTMTMKRKISTRASLIPILRPGPLLLSDTCNPQQAVRERNAGP